MAPSVKAGGGLTRSLELQDAPSLKWKQYETLKKSETAQHIEHDTMYCNLSVLMLMMLATEGSLRPAAFIWIELPAECYGVRRLGFEVMGNGQISDVPHIWQTQN